MRAVFVTGIAVVLAAGLAFAAGQAAPPARAAAPPRPAATGNQMPRAADGKPDLSGIWQALNSAAWDIQDHNASLARNLGVPPGKGVVEGNEIPYKPEALAQKKKNFEKRDTDDPGFAQC